jgi:uncharacterized protein (DUF488 family)
VNIVYTIGYEGTDIDRFIATLGAVGVTVLADVRALAQSRKKGFSKSSLQARLAAEGIAYRHFVELGDPKPGREAARAGRYEEFRQIYTNHLSQPQAQATLQRLLIDVLAEPTCLMCFERDPNVCHRSIVANRLMYSGIRISHLFGDRPDLYVGHSTNFTSRSSRQSISQSEQEVW